MPNEPFQSARATSVGYQAVSLTAADGRISLRAEASLSADWIIAALAKIEPGSGRRHGMADLPGGGRAFIKVYNPRAKHSLWRRLRSSRAIAEGRGYLTFAAAGIVTPELVAWGEVRRRGLWMRGVVITRMIEGPTVAEDFVARGDVGVLEQTAGCLSRVHRAGLAHGDPRLRNFLVSGGEILPFDLCSWGRLSERRRRNDLLKFLGSAMTVTEYAAAKGLLQRYSAATTWTCGNTERLLIDAADYAKREKVP